jgi:hypothetical protein
MKEIVEASEGFIYLVSDLINCNNYAVHFVVYLSGVPPPPKKKKKNPPLQIASSFTSLQITRNIPRICKLQIFIEEDDQGPNCLFIFIFDSTNLPCTPKNLVLPNITPLGVVFWFSFDLGERASERSFERY